MTTPTRATVTTKKSKALARLKDALKKHRDVLVKGCGRWRCTNPNCFVVTGQTYSERDASVRCLELYKHHAKFCEDFPLKELTTLSFERVQKLHWKYKLEEKDPDYDQALDELISSFKHWDVIDVSLRKKSEELSSECPSIDFRELDAVLEVLVSRQEEDYLFAEKCKNALSEGLENFRRDVMSKSSAKLSIGLEQLRVLMVMLNNSYLVSEDPMSFENAKKLFMMFNELSAADRQQVVVWLSGLSDLHRLKEILNALQQYLTIQIMDCEDNIADSTMQMKVDLGQARGPEQEEEFEDRIRTRQQELRKEFMKSSAVVIMKMIELLWKANKRILEGILNSNSEVQMQSNSSASLLSPKVLATGVRTDSVMKSPARSLLPHSAPSSLRLLPQRSATQALSSGAVSEMVLDGSADVEMSDASDVTSMEVEEKSAMGKEEHSTSVTPSRGDGKSRKSSTAIAGIFCERNPLAVELFHNSGLNETLSDKEDSQKWLIHQYDFWHYRERDGVPSFLQYPYLLDAGSKTIYLQFENYNSQRRARTDVIRQMMFSGGGGGGPLAQLLGMGGGMPSRDQLAEQINLVLRVNRKTLVRDTLQWLAVFQTPMELRRKLRIIFEGEEGIDQGGLTKEFFQLIIEELFDPKYGMFKFREETQTYWFDSRCDGMEQEYRMIGVLIGIAIYNNAILDFRFPRAIFKKLLDVELDFDDFRDFDPEMAKGFETLLTFDEKVMGGTIEDTYCGTFVVSYEYFGTQRVDELKENGEDVVLCLENREEYVELYVRYLLDKSIEKQFVAFKAGFKLVCDSRLMRMLSAKELELLVCGNEEFDFEALEKSAKYQDGYDKESHVVKWFWEISHSLTEERKRKLLSFCTGSDRVPIRGLGDMRLTFSKNGSDDSKLPTSHTCFNHVLLPEYSGKEVLEQRLLTAIENSQGFGLL